MLFSQNRHFSPLLLAFIISAYAGKTLKFSLVANFFCPLHRQIRGLFAPERENIGCLFVFENKKSVGYKTDAIDKTQ